MTQLPLDTGNMEHPKHLQGQKPVIFTKCENVFLSKTLEISHYIQQPTHLKGHKPFSKYTCSKKINSSNYLTNIQQLLIHQTLTFQGSYLARSSIL